MSIFEIYFEKKVEPLYGEKNGTRPTSLFKKFHYTKATGWVCREARDERTFRKFKERGAIYDQKQSIAIAAEDFEKAKQILLNLIAYDCLDKFSFCEKTLNGETKQERFTDEIPIPEKKLNFGNWPIKITLVKVYPCCQYMLNKNGKLFCTKGRFDYRSPLPPCKIGAEECAMKLNGSSSRFVKDFRVLDYTQGALFYE